MDFIQFTEYNHPKMVDLSHHDLYFLKLPFLGSKFLGFTQKLQLQIIILMIFMLVISQWQRKYLVYIGGVYLNTYFLSKKSTQGR